FMTISGIQVPEVHGLPVLKFVGSVKTATRVFPSGVYVAAGNASERKAMPFLSSAGGLLPGTTIGWPYWSNAMYGPEAPPRKRSMFFALFAYGALHQRVGG